MPTGTGQGTAVGQQALTGKGVNRFSAFKAQDYLNNELICDIGLFAGAS